jgi:tetratricopeptide (TPR) repeat protein
MSQALPEFFISRAGAHPADVAMAAKVGQLIEAEGHRVVLQQWDFANRNFMERMDAALASGARVVAILTPQYLTTDYCAAEWMHALDGDPLNRKGRLIVLRAAECEPKGLLRSIAYWDLAPIRDRDDLLTDIVKAAIMPDAERRHVGAAGAHWREARALLHEAIKPTTSFTGRGEHLQKIRDALWSGEGRAAAITQPAAVTGLGGVGKTTLAREYAWQDQDRYAGVWWLNAAGDPRAESWGEVEQGLVALGDHFVRGLAQAQDRGAAARYALDFIAHGGFSKPWLLIFDNVDNPRVLDVWRPRGNVHVLITSRISNWNLGVSPIEVDAWELAEAVAYLITETGRTDLSEMQLAELGEALGRLPLALSHAAAYLRRRKAVTIKDYLDDLDRHMSELPKDAEYRSPVYATFRAALLQAEQEASGATALMSLAAFFAPDDIPKELFQQNAALYGQDLEPVVSKPVRLAELLGVLDDLSLIDFEPETRTFSTHRVVQAAARDALGSNRGAWAERAVEIAFSAFPKHARQAWSERARLVAHVRALNSHVPAEAATRNLGWLMGAAGEYLREVAALPGYAPGFFFAIGESLTKADPDVSLSPVWRDDVHRAQGNLRDALAAYQASIAIRERLAKADPGNAEGQRDLYETQDKIGDVLRAQGNLRDALAAYQASIAIAEADPENAGWLRVPSLSQEGMLLAKGKFSDKVYQAYLRIFEVFEADRKGWQRDYREEWQRDLAVAHNKIGDVLRAQGNLRDALAAHQASLAIRERLTKADPENAEWQRDLAVAHNKIGDVLRAQGNLRDALAAYQAPLAIRERLAKADPENAGWQRDLARAQDKIGDVLRAQGNLRDALAAHQASLAIRERLAKADPENAGWRRDVAISNERLGDIYLQEENPMEARLAFERALGLYETHIARNPGDAPSQLYSVIPHWRLSRLDPKNARRHLEAALAILMPLAAANRLDTNRRTWIEQMENELSKL